MTRDDLPTATTLLFVPGDRPDRFDKAVSSGADIVVVDLEDAVATAAKETARENAAAICARPGTAVRINGIGTPWYQDDVTRLAAAGVRIVVLPKAQTGAEVESLAGATGSSVIALIETATGVIAASEIARSAGAARLAFGSFDLAAELGVSPDDRLAMASARGALVLASAAAGLPGPIDGVTGAVADVAALSSDVDHAKAVGFTAKLCIHPAQVTATAQGFFPSDADVAFARKVLAAWETTDDAGVVTVDGRMVDRPVVTRAQRVVALAMRRDDG
jgi:citrate lyase subunit beta/citryl-CoA lyase